MTECLKKAKLVIAIGSAAVMEAVAHGLPVIIVGRECGLDMNPLGWWSDELKELESVFSSSELRDRSLKIMREWSDGGNKKWEEIKERILQCYQPVSDDSFAQFLP